MNKFQQLGVPDHLVKALEDMSIVEPSPIQEQAVPLLLTEPQDIVALAQTGTGKTAAFGLPLLAGINPKQKGIQALIISPTRELSQQITDQLEKFGKYQKGLKMITVYGGAAISNQISKIKKGVHVLVATPGRLIDLINRGVVDLSGIEVAVLDEADEMLNMGFKDDIDQILSHAPEQLNTWLFSATMPKGIAELVKKYLPNAHHIKVDAKQKVNVNIDHVFSLMDGRRKPGALKRILDMNPDFRGIIFSRTKLGAQNLADQLKKGGYQVDALHGDLSQAQRERVMNRFRKSDLKAIVATDVAARGIDVNDLTHVIHYQLPDDTAFYTHRSGRTGRAGKKGVSWIFAIPSEKRKIGFLEKDLDLTIEQVDVPTDEEVLSIRLESWVEGILTAEQVKGFDQSAYEAIRDRFEHLTKDQLITQLLNKELRDLHFKSPEQRKAERKQERQQREERPERGRKTRDRDDRSDKQEKRSGSYDCYFMNVGSIDKVSKAELINFLMDAGDLSKKDIGDVDMGKKSSIIEVNTKKGKKLTDQLKGYVINGREIRFNRDAGGDDKPARPSTRGPKKKGRGRR